MYTYICLPTHPSYVLLFLDRCIQYTYVWISKPGKTDKNYYELIRTYVRMIHMSILIIMKTFSHIYKKSFLVDKWTNNVFCVIDWYFFWMGNLLTNRANKQAFESVYATNIREFPRLLENINVNIGLNWLKYFRWE